MQDESRDQAVNNPTPPKDRLTTRRPSRRGKRQQRHARLLALLGIGFAVAAVVLIIHYIGQTNQTRREQEALRAMYHSPEPSGTPEATLAAAPLETPATVSVIYSPVPTATLPPGQRPAMAEQFLPLMRKNRDVVGWLNYPGISELDFPVVQRDNVYYLNRDFSERENIGGSIFLDEGNAIWPQDENLILHGHNMKNGTMFGKLARMLEPEMTRYLPFLRFDTLYSQAQFVPYAVTVFSNDPKDNRYISIIASNFETAEEKEAYVNTLRQRSSLSFPVDVQPNDQLLTLVTCHGPIDTERLAVALRALRPGEDMEALKSAFLSQVARQ